MLGALSGEFTNDMPKSLQPRAKAALHDIWMAPARDDAGRVFDHFIDTCEAKYPMAAECLAKDRDKLHAFYNCPAEHWLHLRTTNPIESTFTISATGGTARKSA